MLRESAQLRPNIYQVLSEACAMQGLAVPIKDIYAGRSQATTAPRSQPVKSPEGSVTPPSVVGVSKVTPVIQQQVLPAITPMRRGRLQTSNGAPTSSQKSNPSPLRSTGDPFAALDGGAVASAVPSQDELSARFPTLDQFSLLHTPGGKFDFDRAQSRSPVATKDITQRVTEKLADEAFAAPAANIRSTQSRPSSSSTQQAFRSPAIPPQKSERSNMVSQGTMTSPTVPPTSTLPSVHRSSGTLSTTQSSTLKQKPANQPRSVGVTDSSHGPTPMSFRTETPQAGPRLGLGAHRSTPSISQQRAASPASSRPSLEGSRPSSLEEQQLVSRSKSGNDRPRPISVHVESDLDYLRQCEISQAQHRSHSRHHSRHGSSQSRSHVNLGSLSSEATAKATDDSEETTIDSNVDFLKAMEEQDAQKKREKRSSSGSKSSKRSSMPSISLSGTKTLLAGRFGDAFRRFESNTPSPPTFTESPTDDGDRRDLTPIEGSEATGDRSDNEDGEDNESLTPEMRREMERRRLAQEERRVEAAAAEYRRRVALRPDNGSSRAQGSQAPAGGRATTIQNKVKSLLGENSQPRNPASSTQLSGSREVGHSIPLSRATEAVGAQRSMNRPANADRPPERSPNRTSTSHEQRPTPPPDGVHPGLPQATRGTTPRPSTRPKPFNLRTGPHEPDGGSPSKPAFLVGRSVLVANGAGGDGGTSEEDFSKRYPNLTSFEMVETQIERATPGLRTREV